MFESVSTDENRKSKGEDFFRNYSVQHAVLINYTTRGRPNTSKCENLPSRNHGCVIRTGDVTGNMATRWLRQWSLELLQENNLMGRRSSSSVERQRNAFKTTDRTNVT